MKEIEEKILVGIIALEIIILAFNIAVTIRTKEKQYKYLTIDNEWGISNNCFIDEFQYGVCFDSYELIQVRQFYEVWKENKNRTV